MPGEVRKIGRPGFHVSQRGISLMAIRPKAWLLNGLLTVGALGLALALTEGAVRLFFPQPTGLSHQDPYGLAMHWPSMVRYLPQYGHDVSFNSAGMRDREHTEEKPAGVFRILLLGDSFMEAVQVPFEASLPSLLERTLAQRTKKRIEVVSAGVSGWGTDDELRYLTSYGLKYQPDLVVVAMTLHNDISDNLRQDWHALKGGVLVEQPRVPASFLRYKVIQLKAFLATRFETYQLWRRVRHGGEIRQVGKQLNSHVTQLFREPTPEVITQGVELTGLLLRQLQVVTKATGGSVALVLLPIRYQLSDSAFAGFVRASGVPAAQMQISMPQRLIAPLAGSLGIPVVDLLPRFRQWTAGGGASLYLEWDGHWNEAGHQLATDVVAKGLVEAGVVR
jgi:hypothetical protein